MFVCLYDSNVATAGLSPRIKPAARGLGCVWCVVRSFLHGVFVGYGDTGMKQHKACHTFAQKGPLSTPTQQQSPFLFSGCIFTKATETQPLPACALLNHIRCSSGPRTNPISGDTRREGWDWFGGIGAQPRLGGGRLQKRTPGTGLAMNPCPVLRLRVLVQLRSNATNNRSFPYFRNHQKRYNY